MERRWAPLLRSATLLLVLVHQAHAKYWDIDLPTDACWIRKSFFFDKGGKLIIEANIDGITPSRQSTVYLCPASVSGQWELCTSPTADLRSSACRSLELTSTGTVRAEFPATRAQQYHGGATFVNAVGLSGQIKFTFLQPDGTHLGTDEKPVLRAAMGVAVTWGIMAAFWLAAMAFHRWQRRSLTPLQKLITLVPLLKVVNVALFLTAKRAEDADGSPPEAVYIPYLAIVVVYRTLLIATVLLIAIGWCVTRASGSLTGNEKGIVVGLALFHAASSLFDYLTTYVESLADSGWPPRVAIFLVAWSYVLAMWVAAFRYARVNVRALRYQCELIRDAGIEPTSTPAFAKLTMFRYFWVFVAVYSIWDVFSSWASLSLPAEINLWGSYLLRQIPEALLGLGIGVLFRPREFSPYTILTTDLSGNVAVTQMAGRPLGMDPQAARELARWTPGMPLPELPASAFVPGAPPPQYAGSLVIQNPGEEHGQSLALAVPCSPPVPGGTPTPSTDADAEKAHTQAQWAREMRPVQGPSFAGPGPSRLYDEEDVEEGEGREPEARPLAPAPAGPSGGAAGPAPAPGPAPGNASSPPQRRRRENEGEELSERDSLVI
eukprot:tig00020904_g15205.t1